VRYAGAVRYPDGGVSDQPHQHTIAELTALVTTRLERMQHRPGLLAGFLPSPGLDLGPFV
jgi:hypothetical protein